ncbi:hypothetical protein [Alkaliphilus sp. B6464]|uniref:hypothetical protein n=1 Tax=Alkaliphilus sp. B6464 TaxID=2731219 RepID=UPI001BA8407E|nr:hypothetical protein [Alkaliphilus sp. B6464]QUH20019.1 hypothetical protein HYG84_08965 [Alkaliphilus sp. B6464]
MYLLKWLMLKKKPLIAYGRITRYLKNLEIFKAIKATVETVGILIFVVDVEQELLIIKAIGLMKTYFVF